MIGDERRLRLLVAAGGTGGHLYPAIAVAKEFVRLTGGSDVTFAGTHHGLETRLVPEAGFPLEIVRAEPLRGGGLTRKLKALWGIAVGIADAYTLLRKFSPHVVMGVGAYVSGPIMATAAVSGLPTLILEPNAVPGLTNRILTPFVDEAAVSWEVTSRYFGKKSVVTGNPVRADIVRVPPLDNNRGPVQLLVFGGSQGSRILNKVVVESLIRLGKLKEKFAVTHQTGERDREWVARAYEAAGIPSRVKSYLDTMGEEYTVADIVVCRAGATTCAELTAAGRPSILVPLPFVGGHQESNATMMSDGGAAYMILQRELASTQLAEVLQLLLGSPDRRLAMARKARALARPDAAQIVAKRLLRLAFSHKERQ